jgi:ligand-binding sensor domain-containing protein/signal transduction histidine kinase
LLHLLSLATSLLAQPRDLRFEHISMGQGLSHFSLTAITQDRQGFLWFGTEHGLNKYDGHNFTIYMPDPGDSCALPERFISCLLADRQGNLWVGSGGGLSRYNPDTDKFDRWRHDPQNPASLSGENVYALFEDRSGVLWVGTSDGLNRFDPQNNTFIHYRHDPHNPNSLSSDAITVIYEDRLGALWIGTSGKGLNRFDRETGRSTHYRREANNAMTLSTDFITSMAEDRDGVLWIGTNGWLNRYERQRDKIVRYPRLRDQSRNHPEPEVYPVHVFSLFADSQGDLWAGTSHLGLLRYETQADSFARYVHDPNNPYSLDQNRLACIYEDRSGVLWVGTYRGGLNCYNRKKDVFTRYYVDAEVFALYQDRGGTLWIGTTSGLQRYESEANSWKKYEFDPDNPTGLSSNEVLVIFEDSKGALWIGTSMGLDSYDVRRDAFVHYFYRPAGSPSPELYTVKAIYESSSGEFWLGTKGHGLLNFDRQKKNFTQYRHDPDHPQSLSGDHVWAIVEDSHHDLWAGTFGQGLNRFDRKSKTFVRYLPDPKDPYSLNSGGIYFICPDTSGILWIGTWGGGLNRYDPKTERFTHYTKKDGLPDDFVKGILPDGRENLWLSTDQGLSKFNLKTKTFKNFSEKDGLHHNVFLSGAVLRGRGGRLYFGGDYGLTAFHPDSIKDDSYLPPVALTSFKVFDQPLPLPRALANLQEISLSYKQNFFSFEFAAFDYTAPAKLQYAYKLEGFDPDWIQAGTRRHASYTNVNPGEYLLRVKGSNSDGVWNEQGTSIRIVITPPFWRTWWFRLIALAAISALIFSAYRFRVNRLLEMERLRTRLAADLHDEIAGNLSSIAMFGQIYRDQLGPADDKNAAVPQHLDRMIMLAQESVIAIREIIWAIDAKSETIHDLLLRVRDLAVSACRAQNMVLKFELLPKELLPAKNLSPEQRKHLWLLLKEAVNNAVKHSGGTELELRALYEGGYLTLCIIDNGRGVEGVSNTARFSGKGMGTMKSRAEQLRGVLEIFPHPAGGTAVVLSAKI